VVLGLGQFIGRPLVVALTYTGMGFPPVVIGLIVYLLLSRNGVLGQYDLPWLPRLFTPGAMIFAQAIIALPLVAGFTMAAVMAIDPQLRQQIRSLGATPWQTAVTILAEARVGVIIAVAAAFGRIIAEVGAVMLVGGNIEGRTRVLTTAIVLETGKGNFDLAIALGIILLGLAFIANAIMLKLQGKSGT
jgi:tungstate transport system permease protein